jgi:hypothetical protein
MPDSIEVAAKVVADGPGRAWYFAHFPKKVSAFLGTKAAVKVAGTINGHKFRSSVFPNGDGTHHLMVNRAMREAAKVGHGHVARFVLAPDTKARTVRVPPELKAGLARNAAARACFEGLAPSHRKAYVGYITEAKQPATRARRAAQAIERLAQGKRPA